VKCEEKVRIFRRENEKELNYNRYPIEVVLELVFAENEWY
jgi:hypothetical protein